MSGPPPHDASKSSHGNETTEDDELSTPEITPDMIEAGVAEFLEFDRRYESDQDAVCRIFTAMYRAWSIS